MPRVSVIMPVFNGELFLERAVESILGQTFADFEFIIVDDGSTDTTPALLARVQDGRVRVLRNDPNVGIPRSLNYAIECSSGTYICRMDADDIALPERIERLVDAMERHPAVVVAGSNAVLIDENGNEIGNEMYPASSEEIRKTMFVHNPFAHPSVMLRQSALVEIGMYDERFRHNEDYDLWLRIGARNAVMINLQEALLQRRIHRRNITVQKKAELVWFRFLTLRHAIFRYYHAPHYAIYLLRPLLAYCYHSLRALVKR